MRALVGASRKTRGVVALLAAISTAGAGCASQRQASVPSLATAACASLPQEVLEASPVEPPFEVEQVAAMHRFLWTGRGSRRSPVARSGKIETVLVTVHSPEWTTLEQLEARLQCHIAWMRSTERGKLAMRTCPLGVVGAAAEVRMGYGQRFIIAIRAEKESAAEEVWRRARLLAGTSSDAAEDGEADTE